jgi:outer membrane protein assembly factor BamD
MAGACTKFQKIRKNPDWRVKYQAAIDYFEREDYYRSSILFEEILPIIRGTEEAELANFYYAYSYFYQKQYILASHYFQSFMQVYSRSSYAEEAMYMYAFSLYKQSPVYQLDQTSTYEALFALQNFLNKYPYSEKSDEAEALIDELQIKLERKAYENAKLYYKIERYQSAQIAFENFRRDFPDSKYQEEIAFLNIKAMFDYAEVSIRSKQEERFSEVLDLYERFIDNYPNSEFLREAEEIYSDSIEELATFADSNNS